MRARLRSCVTWSFPYTWAPGDDLRDDVLVFLRRTADPEHHPLETIEAIVNGECCDVPGAFLQFHLMESPAEIEFGEDGAPVQGLKYLVDSGDGVALADDCGVGLSHVHAETHISIWFGDDHHGADPGCRSGDALDDVLGEQVVEATRHLFLQGERYAPGYLCNGRDGRIDVNGGLIVRQLPDSGEQLSVVLLDVVAKLRFVVQLLRDADDVAGYSLGVEAE